MVPQIGSFFLSCKPPVVERSRKWISCFFPGIIQHPRFLRSLSLLLRSVLPLSAWPDLVHICVQPLGGRQRRTRSFFLRMCYGNFTLISHCSELGHMALEEPKKCNLYFPVQTLCVVLLGVRVEGPRWGESGCFVTKRRKAEMATCRVSLRTFYSGLMIP